MTAQHAVPGTPLEEVRAAVRAVDSGALPPDLAVAIRAVLVEVVYRVPRVLTSPTVAEIRLARVINARAAAIEMNRPARPTADPVDVANAAQEAL